MILSCIDDIMSGGTFVFLNDVISCLGGGVKYLTPREGTICILLMKEESYKMDAAAAAAAVIDTPAWLGGLTAAV